MPTTPISRRRSFVITSSGASPGTQSDVGTDTILDGETKVPLANPNWKHDVAYGRNASRAYFRSKLSVSGGFGTCSSFCNPYRAAFKPFDPQTSSGGGALGFMSYQPFVSNVYGPRVSADHLNMCVARIRSKVAAASKATNVVVPFVELREFRGLVRGIAGLTSRLFTDLIARKQRGGRASDILRYASDSWLSFQFGVKPMVGEAGSIAESIAQYLERTDHSVRVAAGSPILVRKLSGRRGTYIAPSGTVRYHALTGTSRLSYSAVAGLRLNVSSSNNWSAANQFGLHFGALPAILWELTPYSWAVDYFTNVGEYLDDVFCTPPGNTTYVTIARKFECEFTIVPDLVRSNPSLKTKSFSGDLTGEYFEFQRTVSSTLPHPSLRFRSLDEIGRNGVFKALNLGAVLAGRKLR